MSLISKLPQVGTTIFTVMSQLAQQHGALNLSQGFPEFEVDSNLIEMVHYYQKKGYNQYANMAGVPALREQIALKIKELYSHTADPNQHITITAGGTQAIFTAITATLSAQDEVIIFEPAYDCYLPAIQLCKAKPRYVPLTPPYFNINWEQVKKLMNSRTKMIILNNPHNPVGSILKPTDIQQLKALVKDTNILILSDEVYEHMVFDNQEHQSILRFPELAERSFVVFSFGKTLHATGWKVGYCIAPTHLTTEFRKVHQFVVFSVNTPVQHALAQYLQTQKNYTQLPNFFQKKRDLFLHHLQGSKFKFTPAQGTYFQLLDYSAIHKQAKDTDFAIQLLEKAGVASIPISVFYNKKTDHKLLRFCFAKNDDTLIQAAQKLKFI